MFFSKSRSNIKLLAWFNVLSNFRLYSVVAIIYFAQVTHSYTLGISIFSIAKIAQAVFEIPTGIYSDKIGRSNCLRIGAFAGLLSVLLYAIGQYYLILVIGAVFEGACQAFFSGNNDALLYETLTENGQKERYHDVLGKVNSALELAGFIAAMLGGMIAFLSFSLLLWGSVVPRLLSFVISFQFVEPRVHREKSGTVSVHLKEALAYYRNNMRLRTLSLASIIGSGIGDSMWSFQSAFYNTVLPTWAVGFVMSLNFLFSAISFRLSGRIIDKFKALNLLIFQEIYSRSLYLVALVKPTVLSPFIMASASVLYGPGVVAQNTLLQTEFSDKQRATMASINAFAGSCFFAVFGVIIGLFADKTGAANTMLFAELCRLPILFFYIKVYSRQPNPAMP